MRRQQQGYGQLMVEILSSTASSGFRSNDYSTLHTSLITELRNALRNVPQDLEDADVSGPQISPSRLLLLRKRFINMFRYDGMFDREAGVAEAHPATLEWIFKDTSSETHRWNDFSQWLESDDKLYWITGKMGSGKSTLMKYISEDLSASSTASMERRCTPYLLRWAQDRPLLIATFYFWAGSNEETRIQTSVEGLYRTLLVQILQAYPESAPHVSPQRWEDLCLFNQDPKPPAAQELKKMLSNAIKYVSSLARVCVFIDGLDEFEGENDDLQGLIVWVEKQVETLPVKFCIASRPWRVFEDALQHRPHLLMEAFNFNDIRQYVWSSFHDDPNFINRKQLDAFFCNQLMDEIIAKAEGVFLWVRIVCAHLLEAMSRGDLVGDLKRILNALPVQMAKLYDHILDNLELKDHAAKYFMLLQACFGRSDALIFSFADDIGEDKEFSLKMSKKLLTEAELQFRNVELRKRLNSRCRGLLSLPMESPDSGETTSQSNLGAVQYCHRSAKDYLTTDAVQGKLIDMLEIPFDPHLRLCSAHLAWWKCFPGSSASSRQHKIVYKCVQHASKVASESNDMMIRILDDLDPEFKAQSCVDFEQFNLYPWFGGTLLSLTVVVGVSEYVKFKTGRSQGCVVTSSSIQVDRGRRYDTRALDQNSGGYGECKRTTADVATKIIYGSRGENVQWPLLLDTLFSAAQPSPAMVSLLLENHADPDLKIKCADWEKSAWDVVLYHLWAFKLTRNEKQAWVASLCLLLQHGFKPKISDVVFLRKFLGEDVVDTLKLPHLWRHRAKLWALIVGPRCDYPELEAQRKGVADGSKEPPR